MYSNGPCSTGYFSQGTARPSCLLIGSSTPSNPSEIALWWGAGRVKRRRPWGGRQKARLRSHRRGSSTLWDDSGVTAGWDCGSWEAVSNGSSITPTGCLFSFWIEEARYSPTLLLGLKCWYNAIKACSQATSYHSCCFLQYKSSSEMTLEWRVPFIGYVPPFPNLYLDYTVLQREINFSLVIPSSLGVSQLLSI